MGGGLYSSWYATGLLFFDILVVTDFLDMKADHIGPVSYTVLCIYLVLQ